MSTEAKRCEAVAAHFAWFSQQCVNEATTTTRVPDWPFDIHVCDDHRPRAANEESA